MSDDPEIRRPHGREHEPAPEDQERSQEELNRTTRATGGDAPAAGSIEEREAVARGDDELFGSEDEERDEEQLRSEGEQDEQD